MKQIRIKIGNNGAIEAETLGIKGKECLKYLEKIEQMANAVTVDSKFTEEYHETEEVLYTEEEQEVRA